MNGNSEELERSTGEIILFALGFIGFVIGAAGLITTSVAGCVLGLGCLLLSAGSFIIKAL